MIARLTRKAENPYNIQKETLILCFGGFTIYFVLKTIKYIKFFIDGKPVNFFSILFHLFQALNICFPLSMWIAFFITDVLAEINFKKKKIIKNTADYIFNNGRIKTICFDKTGTLTQNNFVLKELLLNGKDFVKTVFSIDGLKDNLKDFKVATLLGCCH